MKFNQLMKKVGYNTVVNVYRVTAIEHDEEGTISTSSDLSRQNTECRKKSGKHLSMKSCQEQKILFLC